MANSRRRGRTRRGGNGWGARYSHPTVEIEDAAAFDKVASDLPFGAAELAGGRHGDEQAGPFQALGRELGKIEREVAVADERELEAEEAVVALGFVGDVGQVRRVDVGEVVDLHNAAFGVYVSGVAGRQNAAIGERHGHPAVGEDVRRLAIGECHRLSAIGEGLRRQAIGRDLRRLVIGGGLGRPAVGEDLRRAVGACGADGQRGGEEQSDEGDLPWLWLEAQERREGAGCDQTDDLPPEGLRVGQAAGEVGE